MIMTIQRTEPATKFFGPNYPFVISSPPGKVIVQLHNLKPGQFWRPALAGLIQAQVALAPIVGAQVWQIIIGRFLWRWTHRVDQIVLEVRDTVTPAPVFIIKIFFLQTTWMINALNSAPGNYAHKGTATLAWKDIPRS